MPRDLDLNFEQIIPRCGSKRDAFEELCCQLARRTLTDTTNFVRLRGAGGDGGVECFADTSEGTRIGWQAKYVFNIDSLLSQVSTSLSTALEIYPKLRDYIICIPFDLTGPTGRSKRSALQRFKDWQQRHQSRAIENGRTITIKIWTESHLRSLLLDYDTSGGMREFFFGQAALTDGWFDEHINQVTQTAGPRYTPELNVQTDLSNWIHAFGRTTEWKDLLHSHATNCRHTFQEYESTLLLHHTAEDTPDISESTRKDLQSVFQETSSFLDHCFDLQSSGDSESYRDCMSKCEDLRKRLRLIESAFVDALESKHGPGTADSPQFRQSMAELMASLPAEPLDELREVASALRILADWMESPDCSLAFEQVFVLSGAAGVGKTHGVCDAAANRLTSGLFTCVLFGHQFRGEPFPWTRSCEALGLPSSLSVNGFLDVLEAAGETSGRPLILCIDAINETRPLRYWHEALAQISLLVKSRRYVRLLVTCRNSFLTHSLPRGYDVQIVEHRGFEGIEHLACEEFFRYYKLEPPVAPILQPELSNPLYLRLLCETIRSKGLTVMPSGWRGLVPATKAFLAEKERLFSLDFDLTHSPQIVTAALMAIAKEIVNSGFASISQSRAHQVMSDSRPQVRSLQVIPWLIQEGLLIEDSPQDNSGLSSENTVRPSFERLGDFLIASELLNNCSEGGVAIHCRAGGTLATLWSSSTARAENGGIIAALSILLPEKYDGIELPNLVNTEPIHGTLLSIWIDSYPYRSPSHITSECIGLMREALSRPDLAVGAMDAVLSMSGHPSMIDAIWVDQFLRQRPLAIRDRAWCQYLHDQYESKGVVYRLIRRAFEVPLNQIRPDLAERWCIILLWFTAAADRRIKDEATRASAKILAARSTVLSSILRRLLSVDDDQVKYRTLLSCYGALLELHKEEVVQDVTEVLNEIWMEQRESLDNAMIRDMISCIMEMCRTLSCNHRKDHADVIRCPASTGWCLDLPDDEKVEDWGTMTHFRPDEFASDFFKYSMYCLYPWEDQVTRSDMGKWILKKVAVDFGYLNSGCDQYDEHMLAEYGGGRSKPIWAERIGKKYQWTAMYQLASKLHDNVQNRRDRWESEELASRFILLEERKLDPTLPWGLRKLDRESDCWWFSRPSGLDWSDGRNDSQWLKETSDIGDLRDLLLAREHGGQMWLPLVCYPSWSRRRVRRSWDPYRYHRMTIEAFLVSSCHLSTVYEFLCGRNLFEVDLPSGEELHYGFVGEYPWGTAFGPTQDESTTGLGNGVRLPEVIESVSSRIGLSWEYDSTVPDGLSINVPSRRFFEASNLWWNGIDGFNTPDGSKLFWDPSVMDNGPSCLLADNSAIFEVLESLGFSLMWSMVGEKLMLGSHHHDRVSRVRFSQVGHLDVNGSVDVGERVFSD